MKGALLLLLLSLLRTPLLFAQEDSSRESMRALWYLQDQRRGGDSLECIWSAARDPMVRERVMIACANIRRKIPAKLVYAGLEDPFPGVRRAAAFAVGQISPADGVTFLLGKAREENDGEVAEEIFGALGKIIAADDLDSLLRNTAPERFRPASPACWSILLARCAVRRIVSPRSIPFLRDASLSPDPAARYWCAFALSRLRNAGVIPALSEHVRRLARAAYPETRMWAMTACGYLSDSAVGRKTLLQGSKDGDWRVRTNALRALSSIYPGNDPELLNAMIRSCSDRMDNVSIAALQAIGSRASRIAGSHALRAGSALRAILSSSARGMAVRREAGLTFAALFPDSASPLLQQWEKRGTLDSTAAAEALGLCRGSESLDLLIARAMLPAAPKRDCALIASLRGRLPGSDALRRQKILRCFLRALASGDIAVVTTAAEACGDSLLRTLPEAGRIPGVAAEALSNFGDITDVEPIVALCDLLGIWKSRDALPALEEKRKMNDRVIRAAAEKARAAILGVKEQSDDKNDAPFFSDYDWKFLEASHPVERVAVRTTRGTFILRFSPREAPFSVLRILKLIGRGFYDGLLFHRVVPNFVIQGGDPRGDGWGGAGWTMRTECTPRRFLRGSVGIASAGTDTEGSQLFVTHCATPHLDGRYSVIGEVERGMDIVDRIQVGDSIISMRRLAQKEHFR